MWARFALALLALQLPSLRAFDFDDEEVVDAPSQGGGDFFGGADAGEGFQVAVTEQLGNAEPRVRGHLYVRPSTMMGGTTGGRVTLRTSQFKLDAEGIDALKAVAAEGGFYTLSMPSVLKDPTSTPVFTSASACALLASRFEEHLQLTMTSTKDRVLALSYTLPVVPESCPGTTPLPRLALDEVIFNTTAVMHFPDEGAKPMGKIHDAAFLPPAAAQAAARAQQQSGMGPGGMPGPNGEAAEGQPQQQQSFLRKYWMYILPVVVLLTMGGGPEEEGKDGGKEGGGGGGGGAVAGPAAGAKKRR